MITDGSLDFRYVFCSSGGKSLLPLHEVKLLCPQMYSLSFEVLMGSEETLLAGLGSKNLRGFLRIRTWNFLSVLVQCPN